MSAEELAQGTHFGWGNGAVIGLHGDQSAALKQRCPVASKNFWSRRKSWFALQLLGNSFQRSAVESRRTIHFAHLFFFLVGKKMPVEGIFHLPPHQAPLVSSPPIMMEVDDLRWSTLSCPLQWESENGVHWIVVPSRGQHLGYFESVISGIKPPSPSEIDTLLDGGSIKWIQLFYRATWQDLSKFKMGDTLWTNNSPSTNTLFHICAKWCVDKVIHCSTVGTSKIFEATSRILQREYK